MDVDETLLKSISLCILNEKFHFSLNRYMKVHTVDSCNVIALVAATSIYIMYSLFCIAFNYKLSAQTSV